MNPEPLILSRNCSNCANWDEDAHCAIRGVRLIRCGIVDPTRVVCDQHQPKEAE